MERSGVFSIIAVIGTAEVARLYDNVSNYVKGIPDLTICCLILNSTG
jgi:hypothetical protein